jgi:hypothetical protein
MTISLACEATIVTLAKPMKAFRRSPALVRMLVLTLVGAGVCGCRSTTAPSPHAALAKALTFHASFDHGPDADVANGDDTLYTATSYNGRAAAQPGVGLSNVAVVARGQGRFGDALQFSKKQAALIFFQAARNLAYNSTNWSGTVSFWLKVDPARELEPGFCDPLQITPRAWNDAAFFVEFEKRREIPFRLGVYADYRVWNPENRKWEEIPAANKPLITVAQPPFSGERWTHVVFSWEHFNTGLPNGVARLYLDGQLAGTMPPRVQTFTWDPRQTSIMLGLGYLGLFDELSIFNRPLTDEEVRTLHQLERPVPAAFGG